MFLPVLKAQGTDEQYARWGKAAEDFGIIGCYAQTEIGHGSNLSNLETTATFMRTSGGGQFILNSPSLSSIKWWIGGLGVISTHALVQAKLIIDSVDYGPHLFIVQIRSLVDHSPLPNVEVGDIGAKFGMAKNDNGWLRFNQAKICRSQLLSRFASVDENGNYNPPVHPKIFYGGMVIIRVQLVEQAWLYLARAVTITSRFFCLLTSRYTTVRRQFLSKSGGDENPVITYPLVKYRLFPLIASCFVFNCVGARTASLFDQMTEQLKSYNADLLPFVHALSSGLKSYFTSYVANAVEESRKICGGSLSSLLAYLCRSRVFQIFWLLSSLHGICCLKYIRGWQRPAYAAIGKIFTQVSQVWDVSPEMAQWKNPVARKLPPACSRFFLRSRKRPSSCCF